MVEVKAPARDDDRLFTIGEIADRTGVATSALRFYEREGLLTSTRTPAGHRRYRPEVMRRVSFIRVAQKVGLGLDEIKKALDGLPDGRTPTRRDWAAVAKRWGPLLDERIALLERMRHQLDACIGCGCLSLEACGLHNPDDRAAELGSGPRYLMGDDPPL